MTLANIRYNKNLRIVAFSAFIGFVSAIVVHFFNLAAEHVFELSEIVYDYIREHTIFLIILIPSVAVLAILAGLISKHSPATRGGGVPFTEGIVRGQLQYKWLLSIICIAAGTLISTLIGLPVGCEGPSIYIGCALGYGFSQIFRQSGHEKRLLSTAGACTGLAVAFNTPLTGIIFSVEEAHRKFSPTVLLPSMVAVIVGIVTKKFIFGDKVYLAAYAFIDVTPNLTHMLGALLVGTFCGLFGCFFNYTLTRKIAPLDRVPVLWRVLIPAFFSLVFCLVLPYTMGVGKKLFLDIAEISAGIIVLTLGAKFIMIITASRSGASGGIFIPMMSLGAMTGALISRALTMIGLENSIALLTLMGACTFFAAAVRAPLTAVVLSIEITGFALEGIFPVAAAVMVSYFVAELVKTEPLYEHMLENIIERDHKPAAQIESQFNVVKNCYADHKHLRTLILPHNCIITGIHRNGEFIFPDSDTVFIAGDIFMAMHESSDEAVEQIRRLFETPFSAKSG